MTIKLYHCVTARSFRPLWTLEELASALPRPMTNRAQWKLTASHNPGALHAAVDGNPQTRYDSGVPQSPGMWVQVELPEPAEISGLVLDSGAATNDFPQGYKIELSMDGKDWGQPVATGNGTCADMQIVFPAAPAKYIRISQTGSHPNYFWSIDELQVLQPIGARKIEVAMAAPVKAEIPPADPFQIDPLALPPQTNDPVATEPVKQPMPAPPPPAKPAVSTTAVPAPAPVATAEDSDPPTLRMPPIPPLPPGFVARPPAAPAAPGSSAALSDPKQ